MTVTVKECMQMLLEMMSDVIADRRTMDVIFENEDEGDGPFPVSRVCDEGGIVYLESRDLSSRGLNLSQLLTELSSIDSTPYVYLKAFNSRGGFEIYDVTSSWEPHGNGSMIVIEEGDDDEEEEDEGGYIDVTEGGEYRTISVERLIEAIDELEDESGLVYMEDADNHPQATVNAIYPRSSVSGVYLQSNEIEAHINSRNCNKNTPNANFIKHCLKWDDLIGDEEVFAMICDEDNDTEFFNITGYMYDDEGDLWLRLEAR